MGNLVPVLGTAQTLPQPRRAAPVPGILRDGGHHQQHQQHQQHLLTPLVCPSLTRSWEPKHGDSRKTNRWAFGHVTIYLVGFRQGLSEISVAITKGFINAIVLCSYIECDQGPAEPSGQYFASDNTELYTT